jgi:ABC-type dipeptide/oligopeptide/nickel transport system permease component
MAINSYEWAVFTANLGEETDYSISIASLVDTGLPNTFILVTFLRGHFIKAFG